MNLKNIMIISADNSLRRYIVREFSSMIKSLSAFVLSFIILTSSVFSQYLVASVSAAEVGAIVAVDLIVELAVTGGIVAGLFRSAEIVQGEVSTGYGFGSDGLDDFASSLNQSLSDDVSNGTITSSEAGTVNKLSGVPIEIICPAYGIYQFLCTNQLANKIRVEQPDTLEEYQTIVNAYWSSVDILNQQTFEEIASDPHNWVTNLDQLNNSASATFSAATFSAYGASISDIPDTFFQTGVAGAITRSDGYVYEYRLDSSYVNPEWDYFVLTISDFQNSGYPATSVMYHNSSWSNIDSYSQYGFIQFYGYGVSAKSFPGFGQLTIDWTTAQSLGWPWNDSYPLDASEAFPGWGNLRGIEATDAIDLIDWCWGDARFWNTDILDLAIQEIADTVDAQVDTGEGTGAIDVPIDLPIDIPIEGEGDIAWPGTDSEEDFDDPPAYPGTDEWADVDETDWPTFDPDPDDPDNPDDPDDPDNPSGGDPPELPPVNIPALLGLFPFCIPFDIKKAIEWFETDDGSDPVFYIPFDITISGRQIVDYDLEINLTNHGIRTVVIFLKSAQVVAYVIVLGYATSKVIY